SPGTALIAAYSEVVARWSQGRRFMLSLPIFDRAPVHPRINEVAGHFTSLSLLEVDLSQAGTFADASRAIQRQLWNDLDHRAYNGVLFARDLARKRGNAFRNAPIVTANIMLDEGFQSVIPGRLEFAITQTPQVLVDQMAAVSNGGLSVWWDAVAELFPAGMLDEMFAAFRDLVRRLATDEAVWTADTSLVQTAPGLLENETCAESGELLHTLFVKQLAARRDEPAVIAPVRTLTYGELHRRAMRIAQVLRESGVQPGTLVAVVMKKGWEQVVAALGILYSRAAYMPVEAGLPSPRIRQLLGNCDVKVALTQSDADLAIEWPGNVRRICVDGEGELDADFEVPRQTRDDLAYVIHTSGSTGFPKGVMIDHRGAVNTILDVNSRYHVGPGDRVFALSSLSFDLSVYDVFGALAAGGAIVFPSADDAFDPAHWADLIARHGVTIWNSVPALMKILTDYAEQHPGTDAGKLRLVLLSGDWIPLTLPAQIHAFAPGAEIISMGGATEASIWSILFPVREVDPAWKSIPYGRAMTNQTFRVLDKALEDCPAWVTGDLYIGGIGLAKGYWNDPVKTAASFITHPRTGERLYRTGDLGRFLPDGNIEFLGRQDFQVKIQGLRIELEEIETVLLQHPAISAAVVAARGERDGPKRLIAWFVSKNGAPSQQELRDFLLAKLPDYMVPLAFVALDSLPLTANGKVDRSVLPEPDFSKINGPSDSIPPRTPLEEKIADIWKQTLHIEQIGVHDDFIALGGDSLRGLRLVNQLRELLGEPVSPVIIFEAPTIAALAERLEKTYPNKTARLCGHSPDDAPTEPEIPGTHPRLASIPVASREMRRVKRSALHG
ncbi:MAG TPA: amino acid adenylation domain-containing protein, partial [Chthoniobacteraceae bacterium]|nr:amino acid adenylation domain-containing protein [Chthoniobacteraceae bacterium]